MPYSPSKIYSENQPPNHCSLLHGELHRLMMVEVTPLHASTIITNLSTAAAPTNAVPSALEPPSRPTHKGMAAAETRCIRKKQSPLIKQFWKSFHVIRHSLTQQPSFSSSLAAPQPPPPPQLLQPPFFFFSFSSPLHPPAQPHLHLPPLPLPSFSSSS